jgi:hypothetical protein
MAFSSLLNGEPASLSSEQFHHTLNSFLLIVKRAVANPAHLLFGSSSSTSEE